jgi:hypothetical protein
MQGSFEGCSLLHFVCLSLSYVGFSLIRIASIGGAIVRTGSGWEQNMGGDREGYEEPRNHDDQRVQEGENHPLSPYPNNT